MKATPTDKLLFVFSFCLVGTLLWICGDRGNQIEHLKANPVHDTVYVVNDVRENKYHNCTPIVQVSEDKEVWITKDTLSVNYRYYRILFRVNNK